MQTTNLSISRLPARKQTSRPVYPTAVSSSRWTLEIYETIYILPLLQPATSNIDCCVPVHWYVQFNNTISFRNVQPRSPPSSQQLEAAPVSSCLVETVSVSESKKKCQKRKCLRSLFFDILYVSFEHVSLQKRRIQTLSALSQPSHSVETLCESEMGGGNAGKGGSLADTHNMLIDLLKENINEDITAWKLPLGDKLWLPAAEALKTNTQVVMLPTSSLCVYIHIRRR